MRGGVPQQEAEHEPQAPAKSRKGKEVVREVVEEKRDMDMEVDEDIDAMELSYPEPIPSPPVPLPMGTISTPTSSLSRWKAVDSREYREVSGLKTWFFQPVLSRDPPEKPLPTRQECKFLFPFSFFSSRRF